MLLLHYVPATFPEFRCESMVNVPGERTGRFSSDWNVGWLAAFEVAAAVLQSVAEQKRFGVFVIGFD